MTTREQWIAPQVAAHGGHSGFRLLSNGLDAFVARAALIEMAERTLDLQYYIFHPDKTGSLIIDRGPGYMKYRRPLLKAACASPTSRTLASGVPSAPDSYRICRSSP